MIRNATLFSLITILAVNFCFAGENSKSSLKHQANGLKVQNILNRQLDNAYHEKATQASKNPVHVRSYVKKFQNFTADELDAIKPIMVELLNDHLLGRIDLLQ